MRIQVIIQSVFLVVLFAVQLGCDSDGNAQQVNSELNILFSGTFVPAPANTDTIDDGRPASLRTYQGQGEFGNSNITILDEFAQPIPPANCPLDNLEFDLVQGSFVIRVNNGDLLLGTIESGFSCFDPVARRSEIFEEGIITDGTGQFAGASGVVEISTNSIFQNTTAVDGFASGGSTGEFNSTIEFP
ncbi:MAG: hypothetical protein DHS20C13_14250 [Thermodesulfobacteriota bacterium]|nr:MAG: hypothetical protein DHS20C13_14250 [Thermodesulfobacteriota bacterium]